MTAGWMRPYGRALLDCGYPLIPIRPLHKDPAVRVDALP